MPNYIILAESAIIQSQGHVEKLKAEASAAAAKRQDIVAKLIEFNAVQAAPTKGKMRWGDIPVGQKRGIDPREWAIEMYRYEIENNLIHAQQVWRWDPPLQRAIERSGQSTADIFPTITDVRSNERELQQALFAGPENITR